MGEEFSFFDLKRMHSSSLGPPAGSAPAQRFIHTPSLHLLPWAMVSCSPSIPPWEGKGPTHRLSLQSCLYRLSSGYGFNTTFIRELSTQSVNLSRTPRVSVWGRGWQRWGPPLKSEKGVVFVVRTEPWSIVGKKLRTYTWKLGIWLI